MGGIQSEVALPGDPTFNQINNNYDTPSLKEYVQNSEFHLGQALGRAAERG